MEELKRRLETQFLGKKIESVEVKQGEYDGWIVIFSVSGTEYRITVDTDGDGDYTGIDSKDGACISWDNYREAI